MTRIGLLGSDATSAAERVRDAGGDVVVVGPDSSDESVDVIAALGEDALLDTLADEHDAPVLPVGAGREYAGVPPNRRESALDALAAGEYDVEERPTLSVTGGGNTVRALADVSLVTAEVAQISEFAIRAGSRGVDTVRADGVVAATPTGSHGYAADAGGPRLAADTRALAVVPISPFRVSRDRWVLAPPASFTVLRDASTVELFVDGRKRGTVAAHDPVEFDWGEPFQVATVAGSSREPTFEASALEKT